MVQWDRIYFLFGWIQLECYILEDSSLSQLTVAMSRMPKTPKTWWISSNRFCWSFSWPEFSRSAAATAHFVHWVPQLYLRKRVIWLLLRFDREFMRHFLIKLVNKIATLPWALSNSSRNTEKHGSLWIDAGKFLHAKIASVLIGVEFGILFWCRFEFNFKHSDFLWIPLLAKMVQVPPMLVIHWSLNPNRVWIVN